MREHNLNVDYGFVLVSEIEEDLDAQPQDKDVKKKKKVLNLKNITNNYLKMLRIKEQTTSKTETLQRMIIGN